MFDIKKLLGCSALAIATLMTGCTGTDVVDTGLTGSLAGTDGKNDSLSDFSIALYRSGDIQPIDRSGQWAASTVEMRHPSDTEYEVQGYWFGIQTAELPSWSFSYDLRTGVAGDDANTGLFQAQSFGKTDSPTSADDRTPGFFVLFREDSTQEWSFLDVQPFQPGYLSTQLFGSIRTVGAHGLEFTAPGGTNVYTSEFPTHWGASVQPQLAFVPVVAKGTGDLAGVAQLEYAFAQ